MADFNFDKYDIGGAGATAGDGKLTGQEAKRAYAAGYTSVWDGATKEQLKGYKITDENEGTVITMTTRAVAKATDNELAICAASLLDGLLFPLEFGIGLIQQLCK